MGGSRTCLGRCYCDSLRNGENGSDHLPVVPWSCVRKCIHGLKVCEMFTELCVKDQED